MTLSISLARHPCMPASVLMLFSAAVWGQTPPTEAPAPTVSNFEVGLVLDGAFSSHELALGQRERGFGLGHNELSLAGAVDNLFQARATAVLHSHDGETELELEEAFVETTTLPAGLQVRAGRFLASLGYLNEQHVHADDFVERPLLYRAFLGSHYFDDGLRLSWTAPTRLYWRSTVEVLGGRQLVPASSNDPRAGAFTASTKIGGDWNASNSWQLGLSYLHNRRKAVMEEEDPDHDHDHAHGSRFGGRHLVIADAVWKWAPGGNNRQQQLRVSAEYARVSDLNEFARNSDVHEAGYLSVVYRFAPQWEAGVRVDELRVREPHGDHFHSGRLREASAMLAWKPTHFSALRLQLTGQRDRGGFDDAGHSVQLQYVMSLGAHGAHGF
jgi:hypothetical protein